jgi:hypothetical protein
MQAVVIMRQLLGHQLQQEFRHRHIVTRCVYLELLTDSQGHLEVEANELAARP